TDGQAEVARPSSQPDVVRLRPGEVVEGRGVVLVGEDAQVHLESVLHADRALALALPEHLPDPGLPGEDGQDRLGDGGRGDDVHIGDELAPAADAAGELGTRHARGGANLGEQRPGDGEDIAQAATGMGRPELLDAGEDLLLASLSEALEPADAVLPAGL